MVKLIGGVRGVTFLVYYAADGLQPTYLNKSLMCEPIRNPLGNDMVLVQHCNSKNLTQPQWELGLRSTVSPLRLLWVLRGGQSIALLPMVGSKTAS